jgi:hypothetical protein
MNDDYAQYINTIVIIHIVSRLFPVTQLSLMPSGSTQIDTSGSGLGRQRCSKNRVS